MRKEEPGASDHIQSAEFRKFLKESFRRLFTHFGPQDWWPARTKFEVMVGAILPQNTNWNNVERAIHNLREKGLLDPFTLKERRKILPELIRPTGYYKSKSRRLLNLVDYLIENYQGSVLRMRRKGLSKLRQELLLISGIGKETADSILLYALDKPVFVIDAYTRRILKRHGFPSDDEYDKLRYWFESNLPPRVDLLKEFHALLVMAGKTYCRKDVPDCLSCPLADLRDLS